MLIHHMDDVHYLPILEKPIICRIEPRFPFQYKQAEQSSKTMVLEGKNLLKQ